MFYFCPQQYSVPFSSIWSPPVTPPKDHSRRAGDWDMAKHLPGMHKIPGSNSPVAVPSPHELLGREGEDFYVFIYF